MLPFFKKYLSIPNGDNYTKKHSLYQLQEIDIINAEKEISIPIELKTFYIQLGYGFFHNSGTAINRLMSPFQLVEINLKKDFYEFDPQLEIYDFLYNGEKLLFFEVIEGNYLAIDKGAINGKNAIYHFEKKMADSLEDFLLKFDKNPNLLG